MLVLAVVAAMAPLAAPGAGAAAAGHGIPGPVATGMLAIHGRRPTAVPRSPPACAGGRAGCRTATAC